MTTYPFIVFVHVVGAAGIFAALSVEAVSLGRLQRASTPADVRVWMGLLATPALLGPLAMVTTLLSGMWMMAVSWGREPWIVTAFVGLVGMAVLGGGSSNRSAVGADGRSGVSAGELLRTSTMRHGPVCRSAAPLATARPHAYP